MSERPYRGCEMRYPASGRLTSLPPRHYEVYTPDGDLVLDDVSHSSRARSMARSRLSRRDVHENPYYRDMLHGDRGTSPANFFPRSASAFAREIISRSPSPCPRSIPETINKMNREMYEEVREKLHTSRYRIMYPETYRGQYSSYNAVLGRCMVNEDSPGFKYYRYGNDYAELPAKLRSQSSVYRTKAHDVVYVPSKEQMVVKPIPKPLRCM